jgi:hypothetical protein
VIGREAQLAARRQKTPELGGGRRIDDPPLVMAGLGPGVGEQHEDPLEGRGGQRPQQETGVIDHDPQIAKAPGLGQPEQARDPSDEGLAADQADLRMGRRLGREVLAAAEADLQPEAAVAGKVGGEVDLPLRRDRQAQARQTLGQQALAPGAEPMPRAPAVEQALADRVLLAAILAQGAPRPQNAPRKASTRSVRSQENPPSGSGGRPK